MEQTRKDLAEGVKRNELFDIWRNEPVSALKIEAVLKYLTDTTNFQDFDDALRGTFKNKIHNFGVQLLVKWKSCYRSKKTFLQKNKEWLDGRLTVKVDSEEVGDLAGDIEHVTRKRGRPQKSFESCSQSSKRRKLQKLVREASSQELSQATQIRLRADGKRDAAKVLKYMSTPTASPHRANKIRKRLTPTYDLPIKMTKERALAMYVDNKLTKDQYIDIQQTSKEFKSDIFPPYNRVLEAKKESYPDDIDFTEISGTIPVQSQLNHTIQRLAVAIQEVLKANIEKYDPSDIKVIFKWGCDGASGQSRYHQAFEDTSNDDACLFLIMIAPLQIKAGKDLILWQNPVPSSTKYCRPIKMIFHKETADFVKQEVDNIKRQIERLVPTIVDIEEQQYTFHSILTLTMIDGKTCSTLADTANQNCHVCGATPSMMNKLDLVRARPTNKDSLQLGMSSLHAWIKCLECVLNIAYRLDIRKWKIQKENKTAAGLRKKDIQDRIRKEMHLLVDLPKQGYGSSNTGNVARAFFKNPKQASQITGVNEELIDRLATILRTICSGFAVNISAFEAFATDTAQLYVRHYWWYYMPQSVHKLLIHGTAIIEKAIMPIGTLSEEAQEARNKDVRNYREFHARKFSRIQNVEDIMHMLLISSDPLISSMRRKTKPSGGSIPQSVLGLLDVPEVDVD